MARIEIYFNTVVGRKYYDNNSRYEKRPDNKLQKFAFFSLAKFKIYVRYRF